MNINFNSVFWVWFNATSAAAVRGETSISGGQVHIALGRSGDEVRAFLKGLSIRQTGGEWMLPLEPFAQLPAFELPLSENAASNERTRECRIPSQSPRSRRAYPLWQTAVDVIERGTLPQQLMLILRDQKDKLHVRVLNADELIQLPPKVAGVIFNNRNQNQHTLIQSGVFRDLVVTTLRFRAAKAKKAPIARPENSTQSAPDWNALAAYVLSMENKQRATRIATVERKLRDPDVRNQALKCFGPRCQVHLCTCTEGLPESWLRCIVEVHHLRVCRES